MSPFSATTVNTTSSERSKIVLPETASPPFQSTLSPLVSKVGTNISGEAFSIHFKYLADHLLPSTSFEKTMSLSRPLRVLSSEKESRSHVLLTVFFCNTSIVISSQSRADNVSLVERPPLKADTSTVIILFCNTKALSTSEKLVLHHESGHSITTFLFVFTLTSILPPSASNSSECTSVLNTAPSGFSSGFSRSATGVLLQDIINAGTKINVNNKNSNLCINLLLIILILKIGPGNRPDPIIKV